MSHTIFVQNLSGHAQEFEVHGWNNNENMVVGAGQTSSINAPDGSSGAIIALHDGHEGEQAEITKNGFGGRTSYYQRTVPRDSSITQAMTFSTSVILLALAAT